MLMRRPQAEPDTPPPIAACSTQHSPARSLCSSIEGLSLHIDNTPPSSPQEDEHGDSGVTLSLLLTGQQPAVALPTITNTARAGADAADAAAAAASTAAAPRSRWRRVKPRHLESVNPLALRGKLRRKRRPPFLVVNIPPSVTDGTALLVAAPRGKHSGIALPVRAACA